MLLGATHLRGRDHLHWALVSWPIFRIDLIRRRMSWVLAICYSSSFEVLHRALELPIRDLDRFFFVLSRESREANFPPRLPTQSWSFN